MAVKFKLKVRQEFSQMFIIFLKGLAIGFAIAAPVGPIGILCIQRSLHEGFKVGLVTGLGAASADGVYGLIAGLGITTISGLLLSNLLWIRLIGGLFLIFIGIKILLTSNQKTSQEIVDHKPKNLVQAYGSTFFLTLANPMTILSFMAIFAALGLSKVSAHANYFAALILVLGVIIGSGLWWLLLSGGVAFIFHGRMNLRIMRLINRISGSIILLFGVLALISLFFQDGVNRQ